MKKVFLYLYPIEEFTKAVMSNNTGSLSILNECIRKRYRDKGYQVVFALYPGKEIYGIIPQETDKIIYTDITFEEATSIGKDGNKKEDFIPRYPSEKYLIEQLGDVAELVVGGYHAQDCVRRVGEYALNCGIDSIVDLDMTDFFFHLYKNPDYFKIEEYSPTRYKEYMINKMNRYGDKFAESFFYSRYSSPVYGFNKLENKRIR